MKRNLLIFLKVLVVASFFMPLIVLPDYFIFPFIVPKVVFFRSLAILMLMSYGLLLCVNKNEFRPRFSWLHGAVLLSAVSLLISTFVGVDWYNSFWDNHERMLGTFTILHYIIYYLVLSQCFKTAEEWRKLQWWFLSAGTLVLLVGLYQRVDTQFLLNSDSWRVIATLGNPIYVGGYGLFLAYLGYLLGIKETTSTAKRYFAFLLSFFGAIGIFLSGTRGTMVALFASVGFLLLLYVILLKDYKKARISVAGLMAVSVLVLGVLYAYRTSSFVENTIPSLGRLLNSSITKDTGDTRMMAWGIAAESFKDHPIFGWGQNNFYYAFNLYYRPHFMFFGLGETWFDNAHNVIMNTISTGGIFGIVSYVLLFVLAVYQLVSAYRKKHIDIHVMIVGVSFLLGHFIHNVFVFENPTSYLYFFFFLAYIETVTRDPERNKSTKIKDMELSLGTKIVLPLLAVFLIYVTDVNVVRANTATLSALRFLAQGQAGQAITEYERAKTFSSPHIADIRNDFVRMGAQLIERSLSAQTINDDARKFFAKVYKEQKENHESRPMDLRISILHVQVDLLGNFLDPKLGYLAEANTVLQEAVKMSPNRQQIYYLLSSVKIQEGKNEEAIVYSKKAVDLDPQVGDSWTHLALTYAQSAQSDKIAGVFEEAQKRGAVFNPTERETVRKNFGVILR